jgi:hypothetical protein
MSGGAFDYLQYRIHDIVEGIQDIIDQNDSIPPEERYSEETIERFKNGIFYLNVAQVFAQRIDWLVSGDDSEETFHERLNEDLDNCNEV